jgi:hypothetical protein
MPQFDFFSFFVQIFWFSVALCAFYLVYLKGPIKNVAEATKMRDKIKIFIASISQKIQVAFLYNNTVKFFIKK